MEIEPEVMQRIQNAYFAWLTTVRDDGMPQPTPIWFIWDQGTMLIYSKPDAQKVKNIQQNPHVAVNFSLDDEGEAFVVIMGEARIDAAAPASLQNPAYLSKYAKGIVDIEMTPESLSAAYSAPIRVTPLRIRSQ